MANIDIFNDKAFSVTELTRAINEVPYVPMQLGQLGIFESKPIRTDNFWVENKEGVLSIIPTSQRGAPAQQIAKQKRKARGFQTTRIARDDTITSSEVFNIRAFGSESELQAVQTEVAQRLNTHQLDMEATLERMRLGAIQGIVVDSDDSIIYNFFEEFGITPTADVDMQLDESSTDVNLKLNAIERSIAVSAKGLLYNEIDVICSDEFWDAITTHKSIKDTYLNWQQAEMLRQGGISKPYSEFVYGKFRFMNYRGSDDGAVAIEAGKAQFFPKATGLFDHIKSPSETFADVGTLGQTFYARTFKDPKDEYVDLSLRAYPMLICNRPQVLRTAVMY